MKQNKMQQPSSNSAGEAEQKIEVQLEPQIMQGVYTNVTNIRHSQEEFVFDFLFLQGQPAPFGKLVSRVILSPAHAKRLLAALTDNVRKYEENFGSIDTAVSLPESKTLQ